MVDKSVARVLTDRAGHIAASLTALIESLEHAEAEAAAEHKSGRKPKA
jgi:hypothetical protein